MKAKWNETGLFETSAQRLTDRARRVRVKERVTDAEMEENKRKAEDRNNISPTDRVLSEKRRRKGGAGKTLSKL